MKISAGTEIMGLMSNEKLIIIFITVACEFRYQ